jgi:Fic/DOC family
VTGTTRAPAGQGCKSTPSFPPVRQARTATGIFWLRWSDVDPARVPFDVCFYHPFPDGNARAARLALDHVLT